MLNSRPIEKIVFLDIETTSQYPTLKDAPEKYQKLFLRRFKADVEKIKDGIHLVLPKRSLQEDRKAFQQAFDAQVEELYNVKAPLHPEWGRILCITCGILKVPTMDKGEYKGDFVAKLVTYTDQDETALLDKFSKGMAKVLSAPQEWGMCGHNALSFDFPYIAKRLIFNGLKQPKALDFEDKPWNLTHLICTKEAYKMGVYDSAISLDMLAFIFGLKSSKEAESMDGSDVKDVFWKEKDLPRICRYCEADVVVLMEAFLRLKGITNNVTIQHSSKINNGRKTDSNH